MAVTASAAAPRPPRVMPPNIPVAAAAVRTNPRLVSLYTMTLDLR